jgi:hypothetical protein
MAILEDLLGEEMLSGAGLGAGVLLLAPVLLRRVTRPTAKALIKTGLVLSRGAADMVNEASGAARAAQPVAGSPAQPVAARKAEPPAARTAEPAAARPAEPASQEPVANPRTSPMAAGDKPRPARGRRATVKPEAVVKPEEAPKRRPRTRRTP